MFHHSFESLKAHSHSDEGNKVFIFGRWEYGVEDTYRRTPHHHRQRRDFSRCRTRFARAYQMGTRPGQSPWSKALDGVRTIQAFAQACQLWGYERRSPKECRSISTCDPGSLNNLDVSNTRYNRVIDLEGNSDTKITPAVSVGRASLPFAYLYSTPSLIKIGFFFKSPSDALFWRLKAIFLPGGRVEETSSKVKTVTWWQWSLGSHRALIYGLCLPWDRRQNQKRLQGRCPS